ncbi:hypothetical protein SAMN05660964_00866 [Thiothrix caldifontis]|uniref:Uncharacterized protein n=1 Tax=Thiothrix caldifontis TaxID=525918 RepID=A0A1H3YAD8_9GAMM|nr:hypothetical protein [Thiothrix caldifontis]SEA08530.1 hypothetical protein SAMN05660964_00866 [Thiothrix caldifontis]
MPDDIETYTPPLEETLMPEASSLEDSTPDVEPDISALAPEQSVNPPADSNDKVLTSALGVYRQLVEQLEANKQTIHTNRHELAHIRQQIRELSALSKRDPRVEDEADSHGLHTSKVAAQYDDCGSIIAYAEQVRRHVYDNINEAEELLSPMTQSVELLKLRVRHIRLLEGLLAAQENGLRLEIQQRNADACIWQLADILKV